MDHYAPLVFGLGADVFLPRLAGTAVQGGPATEIQGNMMAHNFQKKIKALVRRSSDEPLAWLYTCLCTRLTARLHTRVEAHEAHA